MSLPTNKAPGGVLYIHLERWIPGKKRKREIKNSYVWKG
jgi:hypothetical protein